MMTTLTRAALAATLILLLAVAVAVAALSSAIVGLALWGLRLLAADPRGFRGRS